MKITDYRKHSLEGYILEDDFGTFIAVSATTSRTFKTFRGAERFLEKFGYKKEPVIKQTDKIVSILGRTTR